MGTRIFILILMSVALLSQMPAKATDSSIDASLKEIVANDFEKGSFLWNGQVKAYKWAKVKSSPDFSKADKWKRMLTPLDTLNNISIAVKNKDSAKMKGLFIDNDPTRTLIEKNEVEFWAGLAGDKADWRMHQILNVDGIFYLRGSYKSEGIEEIDIWIMKKVKDEWRLCQFSEEAQACEIYTKAFFEINFMTSLHNNTKTVKLSEIQKRYILGCCALLTKSNQEDVSKLGGMDVTPENAMATKQRLEKWWDVKDRNSLMETLTWIDERGHRASYHKTGKALSKIPPEKLKLLLKSEEFADQADEIKLAIAGYQSNPLHSIYGWDYARYISLCGWGYVAGFLSEEEAFNLAYGKAVTLQKTFKQWGELGVNYIEGRKFWSMEQHQQNGDRYQVAYEELLKDLDSPWVTIDWNLDLTPQK